MRAFLILGPMALLLAVHLQHDGLWLAEAQAAVRAEANADALSFRADATAIHATKAWAKSQWSETRAALKEFRADVDADAERWGAALKRGI
jgi:hypothetical protein